MFLLFIHLQLKNATLIRNEIQMEFFQNKTEAAQLSFFPFTELRFPIIDFLELASMQCVFIQASHFIPLNGNSRIENDTNKRITFTISNQTEGLSNHKNVNTYDVQVVAVDLVNRHSIYI